LIHNIDHLNVSATLISKIISKSISGGIRVNLSEVECFYGKTTNFGCPKSVGSKDFKVTDDGEITMINTVDNSTQAYINYELNPSSKYRLIFKFNKHPA